MSRINERTIIQEEIALLKAKQSEEKEMIEYYLLIVLDQLNPIKKIQASIIHTIDKALDHTINRLQFITPLFSKLQRFFPNSKNTN
jgi:hypothetical protein